MKKNIIYAFIFMIVISIIYPLKYYLSVKNISEIDQKGLYDYALFDVLPREINRLALINNCKGYIIPIKSVKNNRNINCIDTDINLALTSYSGWKLIADSITKTENGWKSGTMFLCNTIKMKKGNMNH